MEIDHRTPLALGGTDEPDNLQILCQHCNSRKGDRSADEYEGRIQMKNVNDSISDIMVKPPGVP